MAREVIKKGTDIRTIRKPINDAFAALPTHIRAEGAASTTSGNTMSFSVVGPDIFFIRLDSKTGTSPIKYAWTMMVQDRDTGAWTASPRAGLTTDDSFAVEINNASLTTGTSKRYAARVNPHSGRVTFDQGGSGGNVQIKSGDTRLMILGTYDDYKDCPGVPPKPPTLKTACGEATTDLCVPAYAYAVYQRCGYIWQKVGDTRDFGVWANETNGGSTSAFRRFHVPCWGGDRDPATWLPDPEADCIGVSFEPTSSGALTCSCPTCLSTPEPGKCLSLKFRTLPRPCPRPESGDITCGYGCYLAFQAMDDANAWDKEFILEIDPLGCNAGAATADGLFSFEWQFITSGFISCDWGPDVLDPCAPCRHWGRIMASLEISGGNTPNCGSPGIWTGEFLAEELCRLLCDCGEPVKPFDIKLCNNCSNGTSAFHWIDPETVEIICCPTAAIDGGSPGALPSDIVDGGTPGAVPTDIIDGGTV